MKREGKSRERWNSLARRRAKCGIVLSLAIFLFGGGHTSAQDQGAPIGLADSETIVDFGSPVFLFNNAAEAIAGRRIENSAGLGEYGGFKNSAGSRYLETGATLQGIGVNVPAAGDGNCFRQKLRISLGMPFAGGFSGDRLRMAL